MNTTTREVPLHLIARTIREDWKNISPYAKPYLDAMESLTSISDEYGYDSGKSVVLYFLANAQGWKGEVAKDTKALLKKMAK